MIGYLVHVKFIPWMLVAAGGLLAEISTTEAVSQSGFWFALAGVIGALGTLAQRFFDYKLAERKLELASVQNRSVNLAQQRYLVQQHAWWLKFVAAMGREVEGHVLPALPPVPKLPEGYEAAGEESPDA